MTPTTDRLASSGWLAGGSALVLASSALLAAGGDVDSLERSTARAVYDLPTATTGVLEVVMWFGTRLAIGAIALSVLVSGRARAALVVLLAGWAAWLVTAVLKHVVERPRPDLATLDRTLRDVVDGWGYPSAHTSVAFALAVALVLTIDARWVGVVAVAAAVLTGIARIHLGVHWPLDVAGGMAVGVLAGMGAARAVDAVSRRLERQPTPP